MFKWFGSIFRKTWNWVKGCFGWSNSAAKEPETSTSSLPETASPSQVLIPEVMSENTEVPEAIADVLKQAFREAKSLARQQIQAGGRLPRKAYRKAVDELTHQIMKNMCKPADPQMETTYALSVSCDVVYAA